MSLSYWKSYDKRNDNKFKKDSIDKGYDHFLRTKMRLENEKEFIESANILLNALKRETNESRRTDPSQSL